MKQPMKMFLQAAGLILLALAGLACNQNDQYKGVVLPPTPVLTVQTYWGVVDFAYLKVRSEPKSESDLITMLRAGSIVEILSSTSNEEQNEGKLGRWYQILFQGRRGWVFGPYIKIFDSIEKARNAAKTAGK